MAIYSLCEHKLDNPAIRRGITVLMNLAVIPLILTWTVVGVVLFPPGFLLMRTVLGYSTLYTVRKCIWIYGRVWQKLLGLFAGFSPVDINGQPFEHPGIIVVNHRSFFDTYCMNMMPVSDVCFAVRAWPFKIPMYNIFMRLAGYINIENDSWDKALAVSKQNLERGSFILFFPEGHRSTDRQIQRFYSGAFKMAVEHKVPVIPICLTGTEDLLPPGRHYLKPARIKMEILEPVHPDGFSGEMAHIALQKCVKGKMSRCLARMDTKPG